MAEQSEIDAEKQASSVIDALAKEMVPHARVIWRWGDGNGGGVFEKITHVFYLAGLRRNVNLESIPAPHTGFLFIPEFVQTTQSVNAALLLSYIYSFGRTNIELSRDKITLDTGLSHKQQRTAEQILKDHGLLSVARKGLPARNVYSINAAINLIMRGE